MVLIFQAGFPTANKTHIRIEPWKLILEIKKKSPVQPVHINMAVKAYLEIPDGHCSINAGGAEFTTISFVYLINRHLAENREREL